MFVLFLHKKKWFLYLFAKKGKEDRKERIEVKTNRDLLMEQLQNASTEDFISLSWYGKCSRCSNNFWDGNQDRCHVNINESSCELGYKEWLESYPEENLQEKYHKKYWCFKDCISAHLGKELVDILYISKAIAPPLEVENACKEKCCAAKSCAGTECYMYYQHILNLYNKYVKEMAEKKAEERYPYSKSKIREDCISDYIRDIKSSFRLETFLCNVLVPKIQDKLIQGKAKQILAFKKKHEGRKEKENEES